MVLGKHSLWLGELLSGETQAPAAAVIQDAAWGKVKALLCAVSLVTRGHCFAAPNLPRKMGISDVRSSSSSLHL